MTWNLCHFQWEFRGFCFQHALIFHIWLIQNQSQPTTKAASLTIHIQIESKLSPHKELRLDFWAWSRGPFTWKWEPQTHGNCRILLPVVNKLRTVDVAFLTFGIQTHHKLSRNPKAILLSAKNLHELFAKCQQYYSTKVYPNPKLANGNTILWNMRGKVCKPEPASQTLTNLHHMMQPRPITS